MDGQRAAETPPAAAAAQQELIRSLLARCKREEGADVAEENGIWPMPDMVGYYGEAHQLPVAPVHAVADVKKLVCSPDLPAPEYPPAAVAVEGAQCPICHKTYATKAAYQAHQRSHAKESDDPYRCNICSKTFAVPARLTRHYRTHTGEKPFRCEFCSKSFSVKENLSVHRRIHTKERPYKCEVCARAFEHSGKLHRHMRIHTGERPHKCAVCAKTFIQSGQLVIHMRTHTGEKPYVCGVCQKGFTCSKQLKVHSRTHTGEKPYSCEICGKAFGYNHVLKLHQVAHYGEKVYKCTICNDTFTSKKSMEAHIKSHAESGPPTPPAEPSPVAGSDKENLTETPLYLRLSPPAPGVELLAEAATSGPTAYLRRPLYFPTAPVPYTPLTAGDDIRRRVEAALAVENIPEAPPTPPESTSPVPSVSPPVSPDPELSLPPRKRSKMILKSMEASVGTGPVRYSSVIHYARAS